MEVSGSSRGQGQSSRVKGQVEVKSKFNPSSRVNPRSDLGLTPDLDLRSWPLTWPWPWTLTLGWPRNHHNHQDHLVTLHYYHVSVSDFSYLISSNSSQWVENRHIHHAGKYRSKCPAKVSNKILATKGVYLCWKPVWGMKSHAKLNYQTTMHH